MGDTQLGLSLFERHPLLTARMDQLARNEELLAALTESEWDLVIVDEAHWMGAHWYGGKLELRGVRRGAHYIHGPPYEGMRRRIGNLGMVMAAAQAGEMPVNKRLFKEMGPVWPVMGFLAASRRRGG